jgi:hypothetical protein
MEISLIIIKIILIIIIIMTVLRGDTSFEFQIFKK